MSGAGHDASQGSARLVRGQTARSRTVATVALYTAIVVAAGATAYFALAVQFAPYDDEGTLLVSLQAFADGGALYREVYSPYGPFYYELFGGLLALSGETITTDLSRSVVIVVWVLASLLFGLGAQRLTGRPLLGASAMIAAFGALFVLIHEPMHPHGLSIALIAMFSLLAILGPGGAAGRRGALAGALIGALLMTKVNLGAYAIVASVLAATFTVAPLYRWAWLRWLAAAGFAALPVLIMARDLGIEDVFDFAALATFSALALLVVVWRRPESGAADGNAQMLRWLLAATAGLVVAALAILAAILATGPSLADVYDGVVREALRVRDVLLLPLPAPEAIFNWGIMALLGAALVVGLGPWLPSRPSPWPGLLRVIAGLAIWYSVAGFGFITVGPSSGNPVVLPLALAWIAAVPPAGSVEPVPKRFLRTLLPALALAETLQVYPVAGSQMGIAAVTFVPVGALCLADGLSGLRAWAEDGGGIRLARFGTATLLVGAALVLQFGLQAIARPLAINVGTYHEQPALALPGAGIIHIAPERAAEYERLVALLHEYECTDFISYPNVNSLYLWSGIEPPPPAAPGAWVEALDRDRQQRLVEELRAAPRPCVIVNDELAVTWVGDAGPPDLPLVRYVREDFETVAEVGAFRFGLPKG